MNTKQLRQKILDLAIRGKLVPQDPADEPASALLQRIREERKDSVRHVSKIKFNKQDATSDRSPYRKSITNYETTFGVSQLKITDAPFEVPESWVWVKIKDIFDVNPKNNIDDETAVSFIPMTLISDGFANKHTSEIRKWKEVKKGFTHFQEGDIGIAKITPCFENRKSVIFKDLANNYGAGTTELHILRPKSDEILNAYLLFFAKTEMFITSGVQQFSGAVGQQRVGKNVLEETFIPLPPLAEQHRIVSVIESAFALIDKIEKNKTSLKQIIKQAKAKTLDLAIRGKLVKQDETKTKTTADNSPYPFEDWKEFELGEVLDYEQPTNYIVSSTEYSDSYETPVLTAGKSFIIGYTNENYGIYNALPVIIFDDFTTESKYVDFSFKVKSSAMKILTANKTLADTNFLFYLMQTIEVHHDTHKRYWISEYSKNKILLPSLPEQHRIVARIEQIFTRLDEIETALTTK